MLAAYSSLHDAIAPFTECQDSISETETEGVSETLTKTLGETITDSLSETVTRTEGTNSSYSKTEGVSEGTSKNKVPNIIKTFLAVKLLVLTKVIMSQIQSNLVLILILHRQTKKARQRVLQHKTQLPKGQIEEQLKAQLSKLLGLTQQQRLMLICLIVI